MIALTASGALAGAAACPSGSRRARSPGVRGSAPVGPAAHDVSEDAPASVTPAAAGAPPSTSADPGVGGRSTLTPPDHIPFSYGIPSRSENCHHRSITRGSPATGPPPRPKSRL